MPAATSADTGPPVPPPRTTRSRRPDPTDDRWGRHTAHTLPRTDSLTGACRRRAACNDCGLTAPCWRRAARWVPWACCSPPPRPGDRHHGESAGRGGGPAAVAAPARGPATLTQPIEASPSRSDRPEHRHRGQERHRTDRAVGSRRVPAEKRVTRMRPRWRPGGSLVSAARFERMVTDGHEDRPRLS